MGSPIDPVTGLPMVGVPDVVSQIPLGVQVVPWDDILATDRPQGGPSYPNDIIDTFAWITGENIEQPGTVHAATMTGQRRLRVEATISGGSGGGGSQPTTWDQATGVNIGGSNSIANHLLTYPQKIYSISAGLVAEDNPPTAFSSITLAHGVMNNTGDVAILLTLTMAYDPATGGGELSCSDSIYFGPDGLSPWGSDTTPRTLNWGYVNRNAWAGTLTLVSDISFG